MAAVKTVLISLVSLLVFSLTVDATTVQCPFDPSDCTCTDPQSSVAFDNSNCVSRDGQIPKFNGTTGMYSVFGEFDITFTSQRVETNAFINFQTIQFLNLLHPPTAGSPQQQWQTNAFYGPVIKGFGVANMASVIPPPAPLKAIGGYVEKLQFVNCREIVSLDAQIFFNFQVLKILMIKDTTISNINDAAFKGLENSLTEIWLMNANLKTFPSAALKPLKTLFRIDVSDSNIQSFASNDFSGFPQLTFLILDGNNVQAAINSGALHSLPTALTTLFLGRSNPPLKSIPSTVIENAPQITILSLAGNDIGAIRIGDFPAGNNIMSLDLGDNLISTIQAGALSYLSLTGNLVLSRSRLTTLDFSLFNGMNNLYSVAIDNTPSLRALTVSYVDSVPTSLKIIDAGDCGIQTIDPKFDRIISREHFQVLNISNNKIDCSQNIDWMAKHILCASVRIETTNTQCRDSGEDLPGFLKKRVPDACSTGSSSTFSTATGTTTPYTGTGSTSTPTTTHGTAPPTKGASYQTASILLTAGTVMILKVVNLV